MIPASSQNTKAQGEVLLTRCLARDPRAWTELVLALDPVIVPCLAGRLGAERHYALEDLRSEVLDALVAREMLVLRVFRMRPLDHLRAYVHRVACNRVAAYLAPRKRAPAGESAFACETHAAAAGSAVRQTAIDEADAQGAGRRVGGAPAGLLARLRASGHPVPDVSQCPRLSPATIKRTHAWHAVSE